MKLFYYALGPSLVKVGKRDGDGEIEEREREETDREKKRKKFFFARSRRHRLAPLTSFPLFSLFAFRREPPPLLPSPFIATMPLYQVAIPAIVLAHAIGLALLLYSLEKVSGIVSRTTRKLTWKKNKGAAAASSPSNAAEFRRGRARRQPLGALPAAEPDQVDPQHGQEQGVGPRLRLHGEF